MVMLAKGKGGAKAFGEEPVVLVAMGDVLASRVEGRNLSGSKEGRRGYSLQSPNVLKAVCSVSLSVNRTRWILNRAGWEGELWAVELSAALSEGLRSPSECSISVTVLGIRLVKGTFSSGMV